MKKYLLTIMLVIAVSGLNFAQEVWHPYPLVVNRVFVTGTDSYLRYSVFDSVLNVTIVDSTPVYNSQIQWAASGGLLGYNVQYSDSGMYKVFYDVGTGTFVKDRHVPFVGQDCGGAPTIFGSYFGYYYCKNSGVDEYYYISYADIVGNSFPTSGFSYYEQWGFSALYDNGWFRDFEGGAILIGLPDVINAFTIQPGFAPNSLGLGCLDGNLSANVIDGIMEINSFDASDTTTKYGSNDGCGTLTFYDPFLTYTTNGIVVHHTDTSVYLLNNDAQLNQWVSSPPFPYNPNQTNFWIKDRVAFSATNMFGYDMIYFAAYSFPNHSWVIDSVQSNQAINLAINNGTITWHDSAGTFFMRGYNDSIGWGNFPTPLQVEFFLENLSPSNGNLIYVRNYTIGSDSILFDFGDGDTTTRKSDSHLYKNSMGSYRSQVGASYNVCLTAGNQTKCKTVSFPTSITQAEPTKKLIGLRYPKERGMFLFDNKTNNKLLIKIVNTAGQTVTAFNCESSVMSFNLSSRPKGVYVLNALGADGKFCESIKFVNH